MVVGDRKILKVVVVLEELCLKLFQRHIHHKKMIPEVVPLVVIRMIRWEKLSYKAHDGLCNIFLLVILVIIMKYSLA